MLQRLSQIERPIFLYSELRRFSEVDIQALYGDGILRKTSNATEIPRPDHNPGGGYLMVRQTSRGVFGVADEDEYFDPIPLMEDDIRQYTVSLPKLVDAIRRENSISGEGFKNSGGLIHLGRKHLDGYESADVFLSLSLGEESRLFLHSQRLRNPASPTRTIFLITSPLSLSPEGQQGLITAGVRTIPLTGISAFGSLRVNWESALERSVSGLAAEYSAETRIFRNQGANWLVVYNGKDNTFKNTKGMHYLGYLIQNPGQSIHAARLSGTGSVEEPAPIISSGIDILDPKAKSEYRLRMESLNESIKEAEADGRDDDVRRLREEFNAIADQLKSATGLRGRSRKVPDDAERARQAVSKAIHTALKAIKKENESLWKHLKNSLQIGEFLSYQPDPPIIWIS